MLHFFFSEGIFVPLTPSSARKHVTQLFNLTRAKGKRAHSKRIAKTEGKEKRTEKTTRGNEEKKKTLTRQGQHPKPEQSPCVRPAAGTKIRRVRKDAPCHEEEREGERKKKKRRR